MCMRSEGIYIHGVGVSGEKDSVRRDTPNASCVTACMRARQSFAEGVQLRMYAHSIFIRGGRASPHACNLQLLPYLVQLLLHM